MSTEPRLCASASMSLPAIRASVLQQQQEDVHAHGIVPWTSEQKSHVAHQLEPLLSDAELDALLQANEELSREVAGLQATLSATSTPEPKGRMLLSVADASPTSTEGTVGPAPVSREQPLTRLLTQSPPHLEESLSRQHGQQQQQHQQQHVVDIDEPQPVQPARDAHDVDAVQDAQPTTTVSLLQQMREQLKRSQSAGGVPAASDRGLAPPSSSIQATNDVDAQASGALHASILKYLAGDSTRSPSDLQTANAPAVAAAPPASSSPLLPAEPLPQGRRAGVAEAEPSLADLPAEGQQQQPQLAPLDAVGSSEGRASLEDLQSHGFDAPSASSAASSSPDSAVPAGEQLQPQQPAGRRATSNNSSGGSSSSSEAMAPGQMYARADHVRAGTALFTADPKHAWLDTVGLQQQQQQQQQRWAHDQRAEPQSPEDHALALRRMYERQVAAQKTEQKRWQRERELREREETAECTFRPQVSKGSQRIVRQGSPGRHYGLVVADEAGAAAGQPQASPRASASNAAATPAAPCTPLSPGAASPGGGGGGGAQVWTDAHQRLYHSAQHLRMRAEARVAMQEEEARQSRVFKARSPGRGQQVAARYLCTPDRPPPQTRLPEDSSPQPQPTSGTWRRVAQAAQQQEQRPGYAVHPREQKEMLKAFDDDDQFYAAMYAMVEELGSKARARGGSPGRAAGSPLTAEALAGLAPSHTGNSGAGSVGRSKYPGSSPAASSLAGSYKLAHPGAVSSYGALHVPGTSVGATTTAAALLAEDPGISGELDWEEFLARQTRFLAGKQVREEAKRSVQPGKPELAPRTERIVREMQQSGRYVPPSQRGASPGRYSSPGPSGMSTPGRYSASGSVRGAGSSGASSTSRAHKAGAEDTEATFKPKITSQAARMRPHTLAELVDGGRTKRDARIAQARADQEQADRAAHTKPSPARKDPYPQVQPRISLRNPEQYQEALAHKRQLADQRRAQALAEREAAEMSECTFKPQTTPLPAYLAHTRTSGRSTPPASPSWAHAVQQQQQQVWAGEQHVFHPPHAHDDAACAALIPPSYWEADPGPGQLQQPAAAGRAASPGAVLAPELFLGQGVVDGYAAGYAAGLAAGHVDEGYAGARGVRQAWAAGGGQIQQLARQPAAAPVSVSADDEIMTSSFAAMQTAMAALRY